MTNFTSNYTVDQWNADLAEQLIPNDCMLTLYLILGIFGNTLVIFVYKLRLHKESEERYFIPVLAISDLLACIVCASFGIALNMMQAKFTNTDICKAWWFFAASTTFMSILLLGIIAIHRYLKVCKPLGKQMTLFWKRVAVVCALLLSFALGLPTSFLYGSVDFHNTRENIVGKRCSKREDVSKIGSVVYSGVVGIVLIVIITILVVFYGKIGLTIYRHFKVMKKAGISKRASKSGQSSDSHSLDTKETLSSDILSSKVGVDSYELSSANQADDKTDLRKSQSDKSIDNDDSGRRDVNVKTKQNRNRETKADHNKRVMYKFTLMFMVITIVFLVCYIPKVLLLILEGRNPKFWENFSDKTRAAVLFVYRSYIINNISNPFIYAFMDARFRREARALITCSQKR